MLFNEEVDPEERHEVSASNQGIVQLRADLLKEAETIYSVPHTNDPNEEFGDKIGDFTVLSGTFSARQNILLYMFRN